MQRYPRVTTSVIFVSLALLTTLTPFLLAQALPELGGTYRLTAPLIYGALWPPTLTALLLGAALGGLFERTTRLRFGVLYAACLGLLVAAPTVYLNASQLDELIFTLTFLDFAEPAEPVAVGVYPMTVRFAVLEQLVWLPGPLTGVFVWALLRRPHGRRV